jgi:hypothetical protein
MYSDCLFCTRSLGANEALRSLPTGRRVAFDPARGRLWVICFRCQQWNLTPLHKRWEAVEECESLFRATPLRYSTRQIGLARMHRGLELVRIGNPLPSEMAAWRYGDQFGRRRRKRLLYAGVTAGAVGVGIVGSFAAAFGAWGVAYLAVYTLSSVDWERHKLSIDVPLSRRTSVSLGREDLRGVRLVPGAAEDRWKLQISPSATAGGRTAIDAAALILPHMNQFGGTRRCVEAAVKLLERHRTVHHLFAAASRMDRPLWRLPRPVRLALEMAAHDRVERVGLGSELVLLERSWEEAESTAAIADRLIIPSSIEAALQKLRDAAKVRRKR